MLWGVVICLNVFWDSSLTPPYLGFLPLITSPTLHCWFPVHCYSPGILVSYVGLSPSIEGFGGVPITWGGWGVHQLSSCPCAHSCTFL